MEVRLVLSGLLSLQRNKTKRIQFKSVIHRIVVKKKELHPNMVSKLMKIAAFVGKNDLIDHTSIHCSLTKSLIQKSFGGLRQSTIHRSLQLRRNYDYVSAVHATKKLY